MWSRGVCVCVSGCGGWGGVGVVRESRCLLPPNVFPVQISLFERREAALLHDSLADRLQAPSSPRKACESNVSGPVKPPHTHPSQSPACVQSLNVSCEAAKTNCPLSHELHFEEKERNISNTALSKNNLDAETGQFGVKSKSAI